MVLTTGVSIAGGIIDLTGAAGTITSLAAYLSTTAVLSLIGSTVTIIAQLFCIIYSLLHNLRGGDVDDFYKLVHDRAQ